MPSHIDAYRARCCACGQPISAIAVLRDSQHARAVPQCMIPRGSVSHRVTPHPLHVCPIPDCAW
eukprot:4370175-Prymnesium_polylepis.1